VIIASFTTSLAWVPLQVPLTASHARHRYNVKYVVWDIFEDTQVVSVPEEEWAKPGIRVEDMARGLSNAIMAACASSIPVKKMRQLCHRGGIRS
jgi:hypothetical protein